jgi:hypothetical protein
MESLVQLNIGGFKFSTTRETLESSGRYFAALLSGKFAATLDKVYHHLQDNIR